jgi:uncharacterized protein (TIGR00369 family)
MPVINAMLRKVMASVSPHQRELGIEFTSIKRGVTVARLPYSEALVGDPMTGVLHGGVITTLLDAAGGAAVISRIRAPVPIATLDLRIDYLRPSPPGQQVWARVECYKLTHHVAFVRGVAHNGDEHDPVASMAATFMLNTQAVRKEGA